MNDHDLRSRLRALVDPLDDVEEAWRQVTSRHGAQQGRRSSSVLAFVVAATIVVVTVGLVAALWRTAEPGEPAATSTTTVATTEALPPPLRGGPPVPAGEYASGPFAVPFEITLHRGWWVSPQLGMDITFSDQPLSGGIDDIYNQRRGSSSPAHILTVTSLDSWRDRSVADMVESLLAEDGLELVNPPTEASLGGARGLVLDLAGGTIESNGQNYGVNIYSLSDLDLDLIYQVSPWNTRQRFYVLDVGGNTVVVWIEAPLDTFDSFVESIAGELESLRFID